MQFLVTVTLTDLAAAADLDAHRAYLKEQLAAGVFLAFGPLPRRRSGWILAEAESEAALNAVLARDPLARAKCARCVVEETTVAAASPKLLAPQQHLRGNPARQRAALPGRRMPPVFG